MQATIDLVVGYEPPAGPPNPNDPGGMNAEGMPALFGGLPFKNGSVFKQETNLLKPFYGCIPGSK